MVLNQWRGFGGVGRSSSIMAPWRSSISACEAPASSETLGNSSSSFGDQSTTSGQINLLLLLHLFIHLSFLIR
ncbi:unnamed protein product [Musa acuminata subsp. burmannicoides]